MSSKLSVPCLALLTWMTIIVRSEAAEIIYEPGSNDPVIYPGIEESFYVSNPKQWAIITIRGPITSADVAQFKHYSRMAGQLYTVHLDSPGGDVYPAMAIGRMIRKDLGHVTVLSLNDKDRNWGDPMGVCLSSCVFILAGGIQRTRSGSVGIHRPFDQADTTTTADQQKLKYAQLEKDVKAYLKEMNVSTELWDHMFRIPPEQIKMLNNEELIKYGLVGMDPYWEAAFTAAEAKSYGISVRELIRRRVRVTEECTQVRPFSLQKYNECKWGIMYGLR